MAPSALSIVRGLCLALCASCVASRGIGLPSLLPRGLVPRDSSLDSFGLYAYGPNISGYRLYYTEGKAAIAINGAPSTSAGTNATFTLTDTKVESSLNDSSLLYIPTSSSSSTAVGFASSSNTSASVNTTGFVLYGAWMFHYDSSNNVSMHWLATPSQNSNVYYVDWDAGEQESGDAISIALRTTPPTGRGTDKL